eukprot:GHVU01043495.1.p1 GENE.GHVU01043495.1~~GHVU01043495.1.p1  ORF type:complete len:115 (-),score=9.14 GHVU01043495.1:37-381(-)
MLRLPQPLIYLPRQRSLALVGFEGMTAGTWQQPTGEHVFGASYCELVPIISYRCFARYPSTMCAAAAVGQTGATKRATTHKYYLYRHIALQPYLSYPRGVAQISERYFLFASIC